MYILHIIHGPCVASFTQLIVQTAWHFDSLQSKFGAVMVCSTSLFQADKSSAFHWLLVRSFLFIILFVESFRPVLCRFGATGRHHVKAHQEQADRAVLTLLIDNIQLSDAGHYRFSVHNRGGLATLEVRLFVKVPKRSRRTLRERPQKTEEVEF